MSEAYILKEKTFYESAFWALKTFTIAPDLNQRFSLYVETNFCPLPSLPLSLHHHSSCLGVRFKFRFNGAGRSGFKFSMYLSSKSNCLLVCHIMSPQSSQSSSFPFCWTAGLASWSQVQVQVQWCWEEWFQVQHVFVYTELSLSLSFG